MAGVHGGIKRAFDRHCRNMDDLIIVLVIIAIKQLGGIAIKLLD